MFLWGNKQERTPTWYGLLLPSGAATPSVDTLQALWTGRWPATRAPAVSTLTLDGKQALDSVTLRAGHTATATLTASGATALRYVWQVRIESTARSIGGDAEALPPQIDVELRSDQAGDDSRVRLRAPAPGNYRLFVEVHDQQGRAGYANLPFRVEAP